MALRLLVVCVCVCVYFCWTQVIDPRETFMKYWDVVMLLCLIFVALVTPFEISFLTSPPTALGVLNWIVDGLFVVVRTTCNVCVWGKG